MGQGGGEDVSLSNIAPMKLKVSGSSRPSGKRGVCTSTLSLYREVGASQRGLTLNPSYQLNSE